MPIAYLAVTFLLTTTKQVITMSILSTSSHADTKEKIHDASADISKEFKTFVHDVESLIKETASLTGDDLARAKIKLNQRIQSAKQSIGSASGTILEQARKTVSRTNNYVHEKPWGIIAAGAAASFVLGMLVSHRSSKD